MVLDGAQRQPGQIGGFLGGLAQKRHLQHLMLASGHDRLAEMLQRAAPLGVETGGRELFSVHGFVQGYAFVQDRRQVLDQPDFALREMSRPLGAHEV